MNIVEGIILIAVCYFAAFIPITFYTLREFKVQELKNGYMSNRKEKCVELSLILLIWPIGIPLGFLIFLESKLWGEEIPFVKFRYRERRKTK